MCEREPKESNYRRVMTSRPRKDRCELRWESLTPNESLAVCPGRAEQSDGNHPCDNHKGDCKDNAHRGTQTPRDGTSGREDGLVPSFVPTTIQPSEILHERFCLANTKNPPVMTSIRNAQYL